MFAFKDEHFFVYHIDEGKRSGKSETCSFFYQPIRIPARGSPFPVQGPGGVGGEKTEPALALPLALDICTIESQTRQDLPD